MNRRIIISCLVLILIICIVLSCISIGAAGYLWWDTASFSESAAQDSLPPTEIPAPLTEDGTIIPAVQAQMELIQRQVIQSRGLEPNGEFYRNIFTPEQLKQRVLDDFLEDYTSEEAQKDAITLAAFGLLDPNYDLHSMYIDLLSEQIAGFYDNETKEMVIVQGKGFQGPERLTYAHEYVHALQDQNYDIRNGLSYGAEACEEDSERCAAIQALLEGDASLSEISWFREHGTSQDQSEILEFFENYESPILDSAPAFLAEDFIFPYEEGLGFVEYLQDRGGWGAVDQAYTDLPVSTEQILHPEKYPEDRPIQVILPDLSELIGTDWDEYDRGVMGEWYTYLILALGHDENGRQKEKVAAQAADGWGGDAYVVYYHPTDQSTVMVLKTIWDSSDEAAEFFKTFKNYANDRFGRPSENLGNFITWDSDSGYYQVRFEGDQTTWILAPDSDVAAVIWEALDQK
jgi:hypothetical protein